MSKFFLFLLFFAFVNNSYSVDLIEEDFVLSKKIPLISGVSKKNCDDIKGGKKAAITLCTTPLNRWVDHVSLIFEFNSSKEENEGEITLFSVHFGGDGYSSDTKKGRPIIDNAYDTLRKVFRGIKKGYMGNEYFLDPIYKRELTFIVDINMALDSIKKIENDRDIGYFIAGFNISGNYYNCCTYVDKCLVEAGIITNFSKCFFKNAGNLINSCKDYGNGKSFFYISEDYSDGLKEYDEYKKLNDDIFDKACDLRKKGKHKESIQYFLESAKKGHCESQRYVAILYYNYCKKYYDTYYGFWENKYKKIIEYYEGDFEVKSFIEECEKYFEEHFFEIIKRFELNNQPYYYYYSYFTKEDYFWISLSEKNGSLKAKEDISFIEKNTETNPIRNPPELNDFQNDLP